MRVLIEKILKLAALKPAQSSAAKEEPGLPAAQSHNVTTSLHNLTS